MKNIFKNIIIIAGLGLCLCSCSGFLSEDPKGAISEKFAQTPEGAEKQVLSLYNMNNTLLESMYMYGELGSDCIGYGGNVGSRLYWKAAVRYEDQYLVNDGTCGTLWSWLYRALSVANSSIATIEVTDFPSEKEKSSLMAEAYALRAYFLLYITETFGPAAYYSETAISSITQIDGLQPGIATFYKRIFQDLDSAIGNLAKPSEMRKSQPGRMDEGVAKALKVRALMALASKDASIISEAGKSGAKACYEEAVTLCNSLIKDYGYKLENNFEDIFKADNEDSDEVIWAMQFGNSIYNTTGDLDGGNHMHRYWTPQYNKTAYKSSISGLPSHSIFYGREYRACLPTYYFIRVFSPYDKRRDATFFSAYCRFPNGDGSQAPDLKDTLLVRSLDILTPEQKEAYTSRGILCDDLSDVYNLETGEVLNITVRSYCNSMKKWHDPSRLAMKQEYAFRDAITIRLGEIYVTLAEAYVQLGKTAEAAETINTLRKRALMEGHEDELIVTAADMNMDFIRNEAARECGGELWNKNMVKRTLQPAEWAAWIAKHNPDACEIADGGVKAYHYYRPVPQSVIDSYETLGIDFKQNEGYKK